MFTFVLFQHSRLAKDRCHNDYPTGCLPLSSAPTQPTVWETVPETLDNDMARFYYNAFFSLSGSLVMDL